ncbi:hypothetical protein V9T40_007416 [Parthenolecanium corni]|uniref:Uncharacterized protein n=1 Tax=Parthenolecanium corni TaxID=536013 RepID=A0AAN9U500_9HEMI
MCYRYYDYYFRSVAIVEHRIEYRAAKSPYARLTLQRAGGPYPRRASRSPRISRHRREFSAAILLIASCICAAAHSAASSALERMNERMNGWMDGWMDG